LPKEHGDAKRMNGRYPGADVDDVPTADHVRISPATIFAAFSARNDFHRAGNQVIEMASG
jgi:hypothetical protein